MLKLYYAPDNASLILRLALEEMQLDYETVLVDRGEQEQHSPAYLAINPMGQIPALDTSDGILTETAACLLWLCDAHPTANIGAPVQSQKRGAFLRWMFFLSNTLHSDLARTFYPDRYVPKATLSAHHQIMTKRLKKHFSILESALAAHPSLFHAGSALSLYICPLLRWSALYPTDQEPWFALTQYPNLARLAQQMEQRDSVHAAVKAEGLGVNPFTRPRLPIPPEGSAI
ncbi:glutathione S-transferase family protein [Epibacterium ulvae]|uniref:glutathione S-transferase family protein n=1 Tax=Epibacterium ulvae TaxID=1156985 RepID=UPI0024905572|nr:glutathione S-transferase family protein [Epibacterium ulvae]